LLAAVCFSELSFFSSPALGCHNLPPQKRGARMESERTGAVRQSRHVMEGQLWRASHPKANAQAVRGREALFAGAVTPCPCQNWSWGGGRGSKCCLEAF